MPSTSGISSLRQDNAVLYQRFSALALLSYTRVFIAHLLCWQTCGLQKLVNMYQIYTYDILRSCLRHSVISIVRLLSNRFLER